MTGQVFLRPTGGSGSGGGTSDHGALTGLFDNDHPQYRSTGVTISLSGDLAQEGAVVGDALRWDGSNWVPSGVTEGGSGGGGSITGSSDFSGTPTNRDGIIYKGDIERWVPSSTVPEAWGGSGGTQITVATSGVSRTWIPANALVNPGDTLIVEANIRNTRNGCVWQLSLNDTPVQNPSLSGFIAPTQFYLTEARIAIQRSGTTGAIISVMVYEEQLVPNGYAGYIIPSGFDWTSEQKLDLNVVEIGDPATVADCFYMAVRKVVQTYRGT